jgi:hypothetical protein
MMAGVDFFPIAKTGQHVCYHDQVLHTGTERRFLVAFVAVLKRSFQLTVVERLSTF